MVALLWAGAVAAGLPSFVGNTARDARLEFHYYVLSLPGVSTIIVGCSTPHEVEDNVRIVRQFESFDDKRMRALERRTCSQAAAFTYYKMG